jgi:hypothetical protein
MSNSYLKAQSGGVKISPKFQLIINEQAIAYAATRPWRAEFQLQLRFKSQFCYLGASKKNEDAFPLGRLRYFDSNKWSLAFYKYSNEKYEPCLFPSGEWFGTFEQSIAICEMYLI